MRNLGIVFILFLVISTIWVLFSTRKNDKSAVSNSLIGQNQGSESPNTEKMTVIAEGLDTPWAIAFLPDHSMLVTERGGRVRLINNQMELQKNPVATISTSKEIGEGGLLGITLHPDFAKNHFVYIYYTYSESNGNTLNRVVRMVYEDDQLKDEQIIVDQIPGASNHNGGRIKFGPDKYLYITTGDAQEPSLAQDKNSLAGKILRVTGEGKVAPNNPFNNLVYSFGHRNPQGIAWDKNGQLWETEHGPSGGSLGTGNDEINLIEIGKNYGWPEIQGDQSKLGMETPVKHSGSTSTWAPAGAAFVSESFFFGGLRGQALYEAEVANKVVTNFREHFGREFGRIREVIKGSDGMLYITTSNRDGRGSPKKGDDRVIKINPENLNSNDFNGLKSY